MQLAKRRRTHPPRAANTNVALSLIDVSTSDGGELLGSVQLPIELAAGERVELPSTQIERGRDAHIHLSWRTADGQELASDRTSLQR